MSKKSWIRRYGLHLWQVSEDLAKELDYCGHAFGFFICPFYNKKGLCMPYNGKYAPYRCIEAWQSMVYKTDMDYYAQQALNFQYRKWREEGKVSGPGSILEMPIKSLAAAEPECSDCKHCKRLQ